jgi:outer membrane protein assembly factor BamE (lipoprotein component of BamABCDE complex)
MAKASDGARQAASALLIAAALAAGACTPVRDRHGYIPEDLEAPKVEVGVDTKATVLARLGTPSTVGMFDSEAWYYISSVQERLAFFTPDVVEREVIAIRFGDNDTVAAVDRFGVERGRVVQYAEDATPTRGRELSIIEQLFGSIGRAPTTIGDDQENPRDRR